MTNSECFRWLVELGCITVSFSFLWLIQVSSVIPDTAKIPTATVAPMDHSKSTSMNYETASDFKEDPFQNYRYEDPFLISDPFPEEEAAAPVVKFEGKKYLLLKLSNSNFSRLKQKQSLSRKRKISSENSRSKTLSIRSLADLSQQRRTGTMTETTTTTSIHSAVQSTETRKTHRTGLALRLISLTSMPSTRLGELQRQALGALRTEVSALSMHGAQAWTRPTTMSALGSWRKASSRKSARSTSSAPIIPIISTRTWSRCWSEASWISRSKFIT